MNTHDQKIFMKGQGWTLKRLTQEGVMPSIKLGPPHKGVAEENIQRAVAALEGEALRHFCKGGETLAKRAQRWEKFGCKATGPSARRLRATPGGLRIFRVGRAMKKSGSVTR